MSTDPITQMIGHDLMAQIAARVTHIEGVIPVYRRQAGESRALKLVSAAVIIDTSAWPLGPDHVDAAVRWGMQVTDLPSERITLEPMPGPLPQAGSDD